MISQLVLRRGFLPYEKGAATLICARLVMLLCLYLDVDRATQLTGIGASDREVNAVLYRRQARALEEKRRSDSRYRTVVEQAGDGILLVDVATGRVTEANYSLRHRLGYGASEIVGLKLEDILVETLIDPHRVGGCV